MFEWLNNWRCIALIFVPRAPTEHNLWRRMHVHVCVSLSGPPHPLPSASWHPFSCFTSSTRLFAFSSLSCWTFSVFHYTEDEQDRIFFFLSLTARLCLPACLLLQAGSAHSRWINLALLGATHHILESDCFPHTLTRWPAHSSITEIGGQTDERARGGKGKCTNMCIMLVRTTFGLSDVNLSGRYAEFSVGRKKAEQCCPAVKVIASKPTNEAR